MVGGADNETGTAGHSYRLAQLLAQTTSLVGSEAKTLSALLRLRTATLKQLSENTRISQSNICSVLDSLALKGLCRRLPGRYAIWECAQPEEVFSRLSAAEDERINAARELAQRSLAEAKTLFEAGRESDAEGPDTGAVIVDAPQLGVLFEETFASVDSVLVLNRGPYIGDLDPGAQGPVMKALARGLKAKALYQHDELATVDGLRRLADMFGRAGVEQRVLERIPAGAAILGSELALLDLIDDHSTAGEPFQGIAVRNKRLIELVTEAFERLWEKATPYVLSDDVKASAAK